MAELKDLERQLLDPETWPAETEARKALIERFCVGYVVPPLANFLPTAYRARLNTGPDLFGHVRELLAPPPAMVKRPGRLNHAGASTLYLSGQPISAIFETRAEIGSTVSILACRLRPDAPELQVAPVAMTKLGTTASLGPLSDLMAQGPLGYAPFAEALMQRGLRDQWLLQVQALGNLLVLDPGGEKQEQLYDLTNGIRDHLYRGYDGYEGVHYPSVVVRMTAPNLALDARRWEDIEPIEVWVTEVVPEMAWQGYSRTLCLSKPVIKIGLVEKDGSISYASSDRSFLGVWSDFKQKYGPLNRAPRASLSPTLQRPFRRMRMSYGYEPGRRSLDFMIT